MAITDVPTFAEFFGGFAASAIAVRQNGSGTTFTVYQDEAATLTDTVLDEDGAAIDLSTHTLSFVLSTTDDVYIAAIAAGSISVSGASSNVYTLTLPNTYTQSIRAIKYALRSISANVVLAKGLISVEPASDA